MDLGFIAGAGSVGLKTSESYQQTGAQDLRDVYASNKDPPGFFVEQPTLPGNFTHFSGSDMFDTCTEGLDVYRLLNQEGNNYQTRKDHLKDDYRRALEDARKGRARTSEVKVRELIPCEYCMKEVSEAYLNGEFLPEGSSDTSSLGGDLNLLA